MGYESNDMGCDRTAEAASRGGKSESRALEKLQGKQIEVAPHWHSCQFELANQICRERRAVSNAMICSFLPSSPTKAQRQVRDGN
jgi:hypothetical protein